MADITTFLLILLWGFYAGSIYILLATGLNLIFGVMKVVNFAHGEFLMMGAFVSFFAVEFLNIHPYLGIIIAIVVIGALGIITERLAFRPVMGTGKLNEIIVSLGLIMIFQNLVAEYWGNAGKKLTSPYETVTYPLGSIKIPFDYIMIILVTFVIVGLLFYFQNRTTLGRAMRATSQNREAAKLMGINVERVDMIAFGMGAGLAALGGGLWAVSGQVFDYLSGSMPAIKAFAIIILGGLGSITGAVVGGLIYGIFENITAYFFGDAWKDATSFLILIIVLIFRPTGLFGKGD